MESKGEIIRLYFKRYQYLYSTNYMNAHMTATTILCCVSCRVSVDIKSVTGSEHADDR